MATEKPVPQRALCTISRVMGSVQLDLADIFSRGKTEELYAYLDNDCLRGLRPKRGFRKKELDDKALSALVSQLISTRMARLAVKQYCVAIATGKEGKVRFNLFNGLLAQMLLFSGPGLTRKPVSMRWYRLVWPFIWQKRFLMPLVQPKGIYCFYTKELINALSKLIGSRSCLEIAAGDGALTRFLRDKGVQVTATDDYSWSHSVHYPEWVIKRDAKEALAIYTPEVVICSWPPAKNTFERQVFRTRSVGLYIVIGSRHRFAAGNWSDYQDQTLFDFREEVSLSRLVVPHELEAAVYLFQRKSNSLRNEIWRPSSF
jgi:hypothetical protein